MLMTKKFNVNHFYKHGFDVAEMPHHLSALLWSQIISEDWQKHSVYKSIPPWSINTDTTTPPKEEREYNREYEQKKSLSSLNVTPQIYKDCIIELFKLPYYRDWFMETCGYKWTLKFIDLWNGSDTLDWHWDGVEDHDIGFLIYFTEESTWKEEWGSVLKIGERDWPDTDVTNVKNIIPLNGTVVMLNNANPRFVHSVGPLKDLTRNRYTINAGISLWN